MDDGLVCAEYAPKILTRLVKSLLRDHLQAFISCSIHVEINKFICIYIYYTFFPIFLEYTFQRKKVCAVACSTF